MKLPYKKLHPDAKAPIYATSGAACFDVTSVGCTRDGKTHSTGLAFQVPKGYVLLFFSRSGQGFKDNTRLANCVGVIDSDYRGEVKLKFCRDDENQWAADYPFAGSRVAQGMLLRLPKVELEEVNELDETERGECGFGSTGK